MPTEATMLAEAGGLAKMVIQTDRVMEAMADHQVFPEAPLSMLAAEEAGKMRLEHFPGVMAAAARAEINNQIPKQRPMELPILAEAEEAAGIMETVAPARMGEAES
jgi:hypothetical protein